MSTQEFAEYAGLSPAQAVNEVLRLKDQLATGAAVDDMRARLLALARIVMGMRPPQGPPEQDPEKMQRAMDALAQVFPECCVVLLVTPFGGPEGARANWICNTSEGDLRVMMKEILARLEGRAHDAPPMRQ